MNARGGVRKKLTLNKIESQSYYYYYQHKSQITNLYFDFIITRTIIIIFEELKEFFDYFVHLWFNQIVCR